MLGILGFNSISLGARVGADAIVRPAERSSAVNYLLLVIPSEARNLTGAPFKPAFGLSGELPNFPTNPSSYLGL
jgi:hypothetical protein